MNNSATTGSIQHEGVRYDSNSLTPEAMKSVLGIEAPAESPAEPAETPAPVETPAEPAAETATPAAETPAPQAKTEKPKKNPQERIDHITREREEARREAAAERARRDEAERRFEAFQRQTQAEIDALKRGTKPEPAKPAEDAEPTLEQFADQADPYAAWMRAMARHDARQEFKTQQEQQREAYQARQAEQREHDRRQTELGRIRTWTGRMEAAFEKNPEMRGLVENMPVLPRPMMDVVLESEIPDQILSHLLHYPEEMDRITGLPPLRQFRELSRIEYQLEQAAATGSAVPAKAKTTAHPPVSPVSGSHAAPASSGEPGPNASYEEHRAYWNALEAEERKSRRR